MPYINLLTGISLNSDKTGEFMDSVFGGGWDGFLSNLNSILVFSGVAVLIGIGIFGVLQYMKESISPDERKTKMQVAFDTIKSTWLSFIGVILIVAGVAWIIAGYFNGVSL